MIKQFFSMAAEHKVVRDSAYSIGRVDKVSPFRMIFFKTPDEVFPQVLYLVRPAPPVVSRPR